MENRKRKRSAAAANRNPPEMVKVEFSGMLKIPNDAIPGSEGEGNNQDSPKPFHLDKNSPLSKEIVALALEQIDALQQQLRAEELDDSDSDFDDDDEDGATYEDAEYDLNFPDIRKFDAKTLGFIACAQETMKYLTDQGVPRDNPVMVNLRNKLMEGINNMDED